MKNSVLLSAVILIIINSFSCKSPSEPNDTLGLQIIDVSCTEAWLNVTGQTGSEVILNRNGKEVRKITLASSSQTIYDDSLLPNRVYTYQAIINNKATGEITAKTLDTTSSDFTWQVFKLGDISTGYRSFLYDIAIINDTLAYAVGEVYLNDSTGQSDPNAYNLARWNGHTFTLKRIKYFGDCSIVEYPALKAIIAFSEKDLVVSNGGSIGWFNGNYITLDCKVNPLLTGAINKIWGADNKNLYVVGNNGTIVHYLNSSWQKIKSGTSLDLYDIYSENGKDIYVSGGNFGNYSGILLNGNGAGFSYH